MCGLLGSSKNQFQPVIIFAASVNHRQHQFRLFRCRKAAFNAKAFHHVLRFADARRIDQAQQNSAKLHAFFHGIPGRSRNFGHDSAVIAQQRIQERAFPRVGQADNGRRDPRIQGFPTFKGFQQRFQRFQALPQCLFIVSDPEFLNIFVRIIQNRVIVRTYILQRGINRFCPPVNCPGELPGRIADGFRAFRIDQVDHRFGRTQIHASVQKSALCEFARQSLPRSQTEEFLQQGLQQHGRPMALKFRRVFPGIAVRASADRAHTDIQQGSFRISQFSENELPVRLALHSLSRIRGKEAFRKRNAQFSRHSDNSDCRHLAACRNRRNGISHFSFHPVVSRVPARLSHAAQKWAVPMFSGTAHCLHCSLRSAVPFRTRGRNSHPSAPPHSNSVPAGCLRSECSQRWSCCSVRSVQHW